MSHTFLPSTSLVIPRSLPSDSNTFFSMYPPPPFFFSHTRRGCRQTLTVIIWLHFGSHLQWNLNCPSILLPPWRRQQNLPLEWKPIKKSEPKRKFALIMYFLVSVPPVVPSLGIKLPSRPYTCTFRLQDGRTAEALPGHLPDRPEGQFQAGLTRSGPQWRMLSTGVQVLVLYCTG